MVSLSSSETTIRPSWLNSGAEPLVKFSRPAQDRVPEPEPPFPAVAGQQRTGGVEGRTQAAVGMAFEGRLPDAGGGVPEVDLEIIARRRQRGAVGAPGDRLRGAGSGIDRTSRPVSASRIRQVGSFCSLSMTAIWAPSGRKARSTAPRPAPAPAGLTGRQVVHEELAILMDQGDPPAVRAESGRIPRRGPGRPRRPRPVDVPDRQGDARICVVAR